MRFALARPRDALRVRASARSRTGRQTLRAAGSRTVRTLTTAQANGGNLVQDFSGAHFTSVGYGAAGFTSGTIGEVIVYDRAITAAERAISGLQITTNTALHRADDRLA